MTTIEKIDLYLVRRGMSGADLERAIGASNSVYSQWKSGKNGISKSNLKKIADFFEVDVSDLLPDQDQSVPSPSIPDISKNDSFTFAMHSLSPKISGKNKKILLNMAQFFADEEEKENGKAD